MQCRASHVSSSSGSGSFWSFSQPLKAPRMVLLLREPSQQTEFVMAVFRIKGYLTAENPVCGAAAGWRHKLCVWLCVCETFLIAFLRQRENFCPFRGDARGKALACEKFRESDWCWKVGETRGVVCSWRAFLSLEFKLCAKWLCWAFCLP